MAIYHLVKQDMDNLEFKWLQPSETPKRPSCDSEAILSRVFFFFFFLAIFFALFCRVFNHIYSLSLISTLKSLHLIG